MYGLLTYLWPGNVYATFADLYIAYAAVVWLFQSSRPGLGFRGNHG